MHSFRDLNEKVLFCFERPATDPAGHMQSGTASILYLLRREILETAGHDPNSIDESSIRSLGVQRRLFATMILCFTAIDLLAKFAFGDVGGIGDRFKKFLTDEELGGLPEKDAEYMWEARNSLVHAFGIPDADKQRRLQITGFGFGQRKEFREPGGNLGLVIIERSPQGVIIIYVDGLYLTFVDLISRVDARLHGRDSADARVVFEAMFEKYGKIQLGP